jgi:peptidoglycan/xylan/chitin deacetylase (PgdA/CDA1 family)
VSLYLPILMYHQIGLPGPGEKPDLHVPPEKFREHLDVLGDLGCRGVGPDELARALAGNRPESWPDKPVMITLDDADGRTLGSALEALAERSWPAAGYFVAGSPETFPRPGMISDLQRAGFVVGSHCMTHRRLTELSGEAMVNELVESRRRLEVRTGYAVDHLSYPYGAYGKREAAAAREAGYRTAVTVQRGNRHRRRDALALRRVPVRPDTGARKLQRYLGRAWHLEHAAKEKLGLDPRGEKR